MGVRVVQTGMSLEESSTSTITSLASTGWGSPERVEDIAVGGDPGRMLTYHTLDRGIHWLEALCVHSGRAYEIVFANAPVAESADRAHFLSVVASFAFLSSPG